jgi:hypothetical protein
VAASDHRDPWRSRKAHHELPARVNLNAQSSVDLVDLYGQMLTRATMPSSRTVTRQKSVVGHITRRKFYDARTTDPRYGHEMLALIGKLYDVERRAKENKLDVSAIRKLPSISAFKP